MSPAVSHEMLLGFSAELCLSIFITSLSFCFWRADSHRLFRAVDLQVAASLECTNVPHYRASSTAITIACHHPRRRQKTWGFGLDLNQWAGVLSARFPDGDHAPRIHKTFVAYNLTARYASGCPNHTAATPLCFNGATSKLSLHRLHLRQRHLKRIPG